MGRRILAVIAGVVVSILTVFVVEMIGHSLYPPPAGVDVTDPEQLRGIMDQIPVAAKVFVIVGWVLGAFLGGLAASKIARDAGTGCAAVVGVVMVLLAGINLVMIPHPVWMTVLAVVLPVPAAVLASRL
jgi:hypothetical protein